MPKEPIIAPQPMFHTPADMAELEATAKTYHGNERVAFTMGMVLAWNLAAHLVNSVEDD